MVGGLVFSALVAFSVVTLPLVRAGFVLWAQEHCKREVVYAGW